MKRTLVQAAWAASRTKDTYLAAKYRKLAARRGKKRALIAIARKMLVSVYWILKEKEPYKELGGDYLDKRHKSRQLVYHKKRLEDLGFTVELASVV